MLNLDKQKKYLLACSFGPDSMALCEMLRQEGYDFIIAHVNYHLRKESDDETNGLKQYCLRYNLSLFIKDVKETITNNVEERCREIRYQFFKEIVDSFNGHIDSLLVAHHQDDLLETYLLQNKRNITPKVYGLSEETYLFGMKVIRPLLNYKKSDLMDFCTENVVPFGVDKTNFLNIYERNKIRHEVIEKLTDEERKTLIEEIKQKNIELEKLNKELDNLNDLSNQEILSLSPRLYRLYLNKMAKEIQPDLEISQKVADQIRRVLLSDKTNTITPINNDVMFIKEYETCFFDFVDSKYDYVYLLDKADKLDTPYFYLDFTMDSSNRNVSLEDYPIVVRNAHKEDIYFIGDYSVKVRRLFIDWKMPLSLRKRWPVILNKDNKIIYIPRYRKDFIPEDNCNFYVKKRFSLKKR